MKAPQTAMTVMVRYRFDLRMVRKLHLFMDECSTVQCHYLLITFPAINAPIDTPTAANTKADAANELDAPLTRIRYGAKLLISYNKSQISHKIMHSGEVELTPERLDIISIWFRQNPPSEVFRRCNGISGVRAQYASITMNNITPAQTAGASIVSGIWKRSDGALNSCINKSRRRMVTEKLTRPAKSSPMILRREVPSSASRVFVEFKDDGSPYSPISRQIAATGNWPIKDHLHPTAPII